MIVVIRVYASLSKLSETVKSSQVAFNVVKVTNAQSYNITGQRK